MTSQELLTLAAAVIFGTIEDPDKYETLDTTEKAAYAALDIYDAVADILKAMKEDGYTL